MALTAQWVAGSFTPGSYTANQGIPFTEVISVDAPSGVTKAGTGQINFPREAPTDVFGLWVVIQEDANGDVLSQELVPWGVGLPANAAIIATGPNVIINRQWSAADRSMYWSAVGNITFPANRSFRIYGVIDQSGSGGGGWVSQGTTPANPTVGQGWYRTTDKRLLIYDGATWNDATPRPWRTGTIANIPTPTTVAVGSLYFSNDENDGKGYLYVLANTSPLRTWVRVAPDPWAVGVTAPSNPSEGDAWWNTASRDLRIYDGTDWVPSGRRVTFTATAPTGGREVGDFWIRASDRALHVFDGSAWVNTGGAGGTAVEVSNTEPGGAIEGSLWFDTSEDVLKAYDGTDWNAVGENAIALAVASVSQPANPAPTAFALWLDTSGTAPVLKVWSGSAWVSAAAGGAVTPATPDTETPEPVSIVSVSALAAAIRVDGNDANYASILSRLAGVGSAVVDIYADTAPLAIRQEAVIRVAAYLFDQPESPPGFGYVSAWRNSGAAALISPWVTRAAVAITPGGETLGGGARLLTESDLATINATIAALAARVLALETA